MDRHPGGTENKRESDKDNEKEKENERQMMEGMRKGKG